jgi:hypothetical protein
MLDLYKLHKFTRTIRLGVAVIAVLGICAEFPSKAGEVDTPPRGAREASVGEYSPCDKHQVGQHVLWALAWKRQCEPH